MAQKTKTGKNSTPTNADLRYIITMAITGHNSPTNLAREMFKPCKDWWSVVVSNKKNILVSDVVFLFMFTWWEYAYAHPVYVTMTSSSPGSWSNEPILWLKILLDSRLYTSL